MKGEVAVQRFEAIKGALEYMDAHLGEPIGYEELARHFHFSPFYFHRVFALIVGKTVADFVRERRLERACALLALRKGTVLSIGLECGFSSGPAFSRAFRRALGLSPSEYRRGGYTPTVITTEEWITRLTNRIQGGVLMYPRIIRKGKILLAGVYGDGNRTAQAWQEFEALSKRAELGNRLSDNGYELRVYEDQACSVFVGLEISGKTAPTGYALLELPASLYAAFDVYVAAGYDSQNKAMDEWLNEHQDQYRQRLWDGKHYAVEYYDERFRGEEAESIVEIWVPIE